MNYYTIEPPKELADYVRLFWVLEGEATPLLPFVHRTLAEDCAEFIPYYKGSFKIYSENHLLRNTFTSGIYGQSQQFCQFKAEKPFGMFGVYLYPYAIPLLFSVPASELSNHMVELDTLQGTEGKILEERVVLASSNSERVKLVSDFLTARLKKIRNPYPGILFEIKQAVKSLQLIPIPLMADNCNLSRRQFERKFKEFSGFSPKDFQRLVRFNAVIKDSSPVQGSLTQIAAACGYYDQSHFIHEFHRFSGYSPKEFFKQRLQSADYRAAGEFKF